MTLLEARYRAVLRLLPATYREVWEEEMVATFLERVEHEDRDGADVPERLRPSWAETGSVVALAVRSRLGGIGAPARYLLWGEAVRRVALTGLLVHAVTTLVGVGFAFWHAGLLPGLPAPVDQSLLAAPPGVWLAAWDLTGLLWVPAYVSLVLGHRRAAQVLAGLALAPAVVSTAVVLAAGERAFALSRIYELGFLTLPVLALAAFHSGSPPVRPRPWLVALPVGVALALAPAALLFLPSGAGALLLDWPALCCLALVAAAVAHLGAVVRSWTAPSWSLALALLAVAVLGLRATTLLDYVGAAAPTPEDSLLLALGIAQGLAVLAAGTVLAVRAARELRRLSPRSASAPLA